MLYLFIAACAFACFGLVLWWYERRWRKRQACIRALLDGADALEAQLQECRLLMQRLRGMLVVLPEEMSAQADNALSADNKVQEALKDLLAHRLWIKHHAADATLQQLQMARAAMRQSGATLNAQIERLAASAAELEKAQRSAQSAGRRRQQQ